MRAAVNERYGPPEVVRVRDVPDPVPGTGDLLVRVRTTTVNRTDAAYRAARPFFLRPATGLRRPRRTVLGTELAGEVVALGPGADGFAVGDRVLAWVDGRRGAHAELALVSAGGPTARVPDGVPLDVAAAATEGPHHAQAFLRVGRVRAGQHVLVHGATGTIGSSAVQLLRDHGVEVTATCFGEHVDTVRGLGAHHVVDLSRTPLEAVAGEFDAVLDSVGRSTFGRCRRLLRPGGLYVSSELGPGGQNLALSLATPRGRRHVRFALPRIDAALVGRFARMPADGRLRPLVDSRYPLDDVVEAHRRVDTGQKIGSVLVDVP